MEDNLRGTGRTTRKVDKYIQDIFTTRFADLSGEERLERIQICDMIKRRLDIEHGVNLKTQIPVSQNKDMIELSRNYTLRNEV